eukprot:gnl/Trimastix_PCT/1511.p1 GENE.gnl/Trimastix_PCT/1511~~gnl/Trimastix_PCT/1511.p1  ORF type:complete len:344 (+),score=76.12 gnl/Trimastix_PCT/1511:54-1085(+)
MALQLVSDPQTGQRQALVPSLTSRQTALTLSQPPRTSNLHAPIMMLQGHKAELTSCEFSHDGQHLASAGHDRLILIWNVYGECQTVGGCEGHKGVITEIHWSQDDSMLYSSSVDKSVCVWDAETGRRMLRFTGHANFVHSCCATRYEPTLLVSGGDDSQIKIWDLRERACFKTLKADFPLTAVCFSSNGQQVYSGGIDNAIKTWDLRRDDTPVELLGHNDTVTSLALSPDGSHLLSNSMDMTLRCWDVRPYCSGDRCVKFFAGHQHNFERTLIGCAWSSDGTMVGAGSSDRCVHIWDFHSRRMLYKLPGHQGTVNDVAFHPREPVIASASVDRTLFLGEIAPN